jgi:hypothetical protein
LEKIDILGEKAEKRRKSPSPQREDGLSAFKKEAQTSFLLKIRHEMK